jgi:hypothetical protein
MLQKHGYDMDNRHSLTEPFRNIITLASLAYTFTTIHTLQYYMRNLNNDTNAPNLLDNESIALSSVQNAPAATGIVEKTSGRWRDSEIKLLLHYVETKCTLTTASGLSLKKSQFNGAHEIVKTKNRDQCHCKGTPLMSPKTISDEPLPLSSSSASASPTGTTSTVLLLERTAEALLTTSDIPFHFYLFIFYYDVIPSLHLSS